MTEPKTSKRKTLSRLAIAFIVVALLGYVALSGGDLLESGTPAPAFELAAVDSGRPISLEALRGKVVVLDFWSSSCPPCLRQIPDLEALSARIGGDDLVVVGINAEGAPLEAVREFARTRRIGYPLVVDPGPVSRAYRVERLPTLYVIDRAGDIRWSHEGYAPARDLTRVVRELL
jgi:peroxiredoxin